MAIDFEMTPRQRKLTSDACAVLANSFVDCEPFGFKKCTEGFRVATEAR